MSRLINITGCIKQQRFEKRMIQRMQQGTGKSQGSQHMVPCANPNTAKPDTHSNNAYIFDAVIGKQFLQVMLNNSEHYTI